MIRSSPADSMDTTIKALAGLSKVNRCAAIMMALVIMVNATFYWVTRLLKR